MIVNIRKTVAAASTSGLVMTAFGLIAANPAFAASCDGVTPIPATEAALRTALDGSDPVICISAGTIDLSSLGDDGTADSITITRSVFIVGLGTVTLDSNGETGVFYVNSNGVNLELQNLTFNDAAQHSGSSAISFNGDGDFAITDSVFTNNSSDSATVWVNAYVNAATITGTEFSNNTVTDSWSGAVYSESGLIVSDSTFTNNESTTGNGGAIYSYGSLEVHDSTFIDNVSNGGGGAIYVDSSSLISGSYFNGNEADGDGGAVWSPNGSVFVNNTFVNNYSYSNGGALRLADDNEVLFNTFTGNVAANSGNAINSLSFTSIGNLFADGTDLEIQNNGSDVLDGGANISTSTQLGDADDLDATSSRVGVDIADLKLEAAADNGGPTWTIALGAGSVARDVWTTELNDAAPSDYVPDVDQRGTTRTFAYDAGAFEAEPELASTGVDATGIALAGSVLSVAGVALVAHRRRKA
jgi:predicted outer membrane repeat protein